jgi:hypothetical protein
MERIHIDEWPPYSPEDQAKKENVLIVAKLMVNAALTAPFTGGVPGHEAEIAHGQKELEAIAREMERLAHEDVPKRIKKPFLMAGGPTLSMAFSGGGNPMLKTKQRWWEEPTYMKVEGNRLFLTQ